MSKNDLNSPYNENISDCNQLYKIIEQSSTFAEALSAYNRLIDLEPCKALHVGERAKFYAKNHKNEQASEDFDTAVRLDQKWMHCRAGFYVDIHKHDLAFTDYQSLIDSNTIAVAGAAQSEENREDLASAYFWRGELYIQNNKFENAKQDYMAAIMLKHSYAFNVALFCEQHSFWPEYLLCLNALVDFWPHKYLNSRAAFFEKQWQYDLARLDYEKLVNISWIINPKGKFSPKAWALICRSGFHKRQGNSKNAAYDMYLAKFCEMLQRPFGFSHYPDK